MVPVWFHVAVVSSTWYISSSEYQVRVWTRQPSNWSFTFKLYTHSKTETHSKWRLFNSYGYSTSDLYKLAVSELCAPDNRMYDWQTQHIQFLCSTIWGCLLEPFKSLEVKKRWILELLILRWIVALNPSNTKFILKSTISHIQTIIKNGQCIILPLIGQPGPSPYQLPCLPHGSCKLLASDDLTTKLCETQPAPLLRVFTVGIHWGSNTIMVPEGQGCCKIGSFTADSPAWKQGMWSTVDGSEIPNNHLGCIKPCK